MIQIPEFAQVKPKQELRLVLPLIELPAGLRANSATEIEQFEPAEIIDYVPGNSVPETLKLESTESKGEFKGGNVERIAARSGISVEVVARAALDSTARQRGKA